MVRDCDDYVEDDYRVAAMETLKEALTNAPALATTYYTDDAGEIVLAVDASRDVWGAIHIAAGRHRQYLPT